MISGATYLIVFEFDYDISTIDKIIFTFKGNQLVTKAYPSVVSFSDKKLLVPLTQEDTAKLEGYTEVEAQVNFSDKSVQKIKFDNIFISKTLATEIVTNNTPSGNTNLATMKFEFDNGVLIAKVVGEIDPDEIQEAVEEYLDEHPIEAGITEDECEEIVATYVTEHRSELKGDKGDKGDTGNPGVNGTNGTNGTNGNDGFSPTATVTQVSNGATISITDKNGTTSVTVTNGANGTNGTTPVRGVDYWTNSDKAEIKSYIDSQIGGALNGSY